MSGASKETLYFAFLHRASSEEVGIHETLEGASSIRLVGQLPRDGCPGQFEYYTPVRVSRAKEKLMKLSGVRTPEQVDRMLRALDAVEQAVTEGAKDTPPDLSANYKHYLYDKL